MKSWFNRLDRLRVLALLLWALPVVALLPLGLFWLWRASPATITRSRSGRCWN
ncbi:MAG: hypothetical protein H6R23_2335 [Proteobacteria bacterium]|nr:hypothetical protein [Pseudomonadota bacterium]